MNRIEISKQIRELKELMQMREELNAEIEHIQDQIKYEMQKEGIEEMQCGIFKVKYTTVKSNRFDTQAFKKTHQYLYDLYMREATTKRVSIA